MPKVPLSKSIRKLYKKMKRCGNNIKKCTDNALLKYYMVGPATKLDYKFYPFISKFTERLAITWGNNMDRHYGGKLTKVLGRRRILASKPIEPERDWRYILSRENYATFKYWGKQRKNTKYVIETNTKMVNNLMGQMDSKLKIFNLSQFIFYTKNSNCPLASLFGATPIVASRGRAGGRTCGSVKESCCAAESFQLFRNDSKISLISLKSYYKNSFRLNMYLLSDLVNNFEYKPEDPWALQCKGKTNHSTCQSLLLNVKRATQHARMYITEYKKFWGDCYGELERLRNQMRCASCSKYNNQWISFKKKKIVIKRKNIDGVIKKCYNSDLWETNLLRAVYLSFLNYASQVNINLSISHTILNRIFPN